MYVVYTEGNAHKRNKKERETERERIRESERERVVHPRFGWTYLRTRGPGLIAVAEETRRRDRQFGQIDTHRVS